MIGGKYLRAEIVRKKGANLISDPLFNKGLAFTMTERDRLGIRGLVPPATWVFSFSLRSFENIETSMSQFVTSSYQQNPLCQNWHIKFHPHFQSGHWRTEVCDHERVRDRVGRKVNLFQILKPDVWHNLLGLRNSHTFFLFPPKRAAADPNDEIIKSGVNPDDIRRWNVLQQLQDRNETLFYKWVLSATHINLFLTQWLHSMDCFQDSWGRVQRYGSHHLHSDGRLGLYSLLTLVQETQGNVFLS